MNKDFARGELIFYKEEDVGDKWFGFTPVIYLGQRDGQKCRVNFEDGSTDDVNVYWLHKNILTAVKQTLSDIAPYYNKVITAHKQTVERLELEYASKVQELQNILDELTI